MKHPPHGFATAVGRNCYFAFAFVDDWLLKA